MLVPAADSILAITRHLPTKNINQKKKEEKEGLRLDLSMGVGKQVPAENKRGLGVVGLGQGHQAGKWYELHHTHPLQEVEEGWQRASREGGKPGGGALAQRLGQALL